MNTFPDLNQNPQRISNVKIKISVNSSDKLPSQASVFALDLKPTSRLFHRTKSNLSFYYNNRATKKGQRKSNNENSNNQRHVSTNNTWKLLGACCEKHQPKTVCQIKSTFPVFRSPSKKIYEENLKIIFHFCHRAEWNEENELDAFAVFDLKGKYGDKRGSLK